MQVSHEARQPIRVLLLHAASAFGGASKSMIELLQGMPHGRLQVSVLCPEGGAAEDFRLAGFRVHTVLGIPSWDDTLFGHYRRVRWLILLREAFYLLPCLVALLRLRRSGFDVVHANEMPLLPIGMLARRIFSSRLVVHVRSLQRGGANSRRTRLLHRWLRERTDAVIAIDESVRRTLVPGGNVDVVHNVMALPPEQRARQPDELHIGIVGVLLRLKGVYEFVEAARLCKERGIRAEFLVVGENVRKVSGLWGWLLRKLDLARDVRAELEAFIEAHQLQNYVRLTGFVRNVSAVYADLDILCFPSHLDAAGRPVFEAALHGVPSIVAIRDPLPDTIVHRETGLCIPAPDAGLLVDAICELAADDALRERLGQQARRLAVENCNPMVNADKLLAIYDRVVGRR